MKPISTLALNYIKRRSYNKIITLKKFNFSINKKNAAFKQRLIKNVWNYNGNGCGKKWYWQMRDVDKLIGVSYIT